MRKIMSFLTVGVLLLIGCDKTEIVNVEDGKSARPLIISVEGTKAVFDAELSKTCWQMTDKVGIVQEYGYDSGSGSVTYTDKDNDNNAFPQHSFSAMSVSGSSATFVSDGGFVWGTRTEPVVSYRLHMYFPYNESSVGRSNVVGTLPDEQQYDMAGDWDVSAYDFMYSPGSIVNNIEDTPVFASAHHVFSVLRLEFDNDTSDPVGISKVEIESAAGNPIAGTFRAMVNKSRPDECVSSATGGSYGYFTSPASAITTTVSNGSISPGSKGSVRIMLNAGPTAVKDKCVVPFLGRNTAIEYKDASGNVIEDFSAYPNDVFTVTVTTVDAANLSCKFEARDIARGGTAVKRIPWSALKATAAKCDKPVVAYYARNTKTSASFEIALPSDATSYKYVVSPLADETPASSDVFANGVGDTAETLTITGLSAAAAYRLHVVATDGTAVSDVVSVIFRTTGCAADYYEEGITIGTETYDKTTSGVKLVTASDGIIDGKFTKGGVYFIESGEYTSTATTTLEADAVIIGRTAGAPPVVSCNTSGKDFLNLKSATTSVVVENVSVLVARSFINQSNTPSDDNSIIIDNCTIKPNPDANVYSSSNTLIICGSKGGKATRRLFLSNCFVDFYNTTKMCSDKPMIGVYSGSSANPATACAKMESIRIYNNTFCCSTDKLSTSLLQLPAQKADALDIELSGNTIYNLIPSLKNSYMGYVCVGTSASTSSDTSVKSISLTNNIFFHGTTGGSSSADSYYIVQGGTLAAEYSPVPSANVVYNKAKPDGSVYSDYADFTIEHPGFTKDKGLATDFTVTSGNAVGKGDPRWR